MNGMFSAYNVALFDSSFYFRPFSPALRKALKEIKVYVGQTFRDEAEQISKVLSDGRRPVYEENLRFLTNEIRLHFTPMSGSDPRSAHLQNDTWGMLNLMLSMGGKFVLITADRLLMHRVILMNKKVDIYDLSTDTFIYFDEYASIRGVLELDSRMDPAAAEHDSPREGARLYRKRGAPVVLGGEISSGMEGTLYRIDGPDELIAKVFKKGKLPVNKFDSLMKLQGINDTMEISWAIFPQDILYCDEAMKIPVGFTERYISTLSNLGDDPLYLGDLPNLSDEQLEVHISQTLKLVLKIVRQVRYLNQYGFYISDYNPLNFSFRGDNYDLMQMWDTDSFGFERFFSGYIAGDKTSRDYDVTKKLGAIEFCTEALYIFAFKMLTLGDPPISEIRGHFKYDKDNYPNVFRKNMIPQNLWNLFEMVFHGDKEASTEVLLHELVVAVDDLRRNPSRDLTYLQVTDDFFGDEEEPDQPEKKVQENVTPVPDDQSYTEINTGIEKEDLIWGVPQKEKSSSDKLKTAAGWIAGILIAAAAALAYVMFQ